MCLFSYCCWICVCGKDVHGCGYECVRRTVWDRLQECRDVDVVGFFCLCMCVCLLAEVFVILPCFSVYGGLQVLALCAYALHMSICVFLCLVFL